MIACRSTALGKVSGFFQAAAAGGALLLCPALGCAQIGGVDPLNVSGGPNAAVRAIITQSDGKIIVAGDFTTYSNTSRNRIARLYPDGTPDASFAAGTGADGAIYAATLQSDGKIVIGGSFTSYNGVARNKVARLNADGSLDPTFNPGVGPNGTVYALAVSDYDRSSILIGGDFTSVSGTARNRVAQLLRTGGLDTYFLSQYTGADGVVYAIASSGSSIYIGGAFTNVNGAKRGYLARLYSYDGSLDATFNSAASAGPNGFVYALALASGSASASSSVTSTSSAIYIGGEFTTVSGTAHSHIAELDVSTGSPIASFAFGADGAVRSFLFQSSRSGTTGILEVIIGGDFTQVNATARNRIARLISTATLSPSATTWNLDASFDVGSGADGSVLCLATEPDGKTILGGQFTLLNDNARNYLGRLYGDGGSGPPATPSRPTAGAGTDTQLAVIWSGVAYSSGTRIERSPDGVNGWTQVSPASGSPPFPFIDSGLTPGMTYFYRVRAYSTNGESDSSAVAGGATLAAPWTAAGAVDSAFSASSGAGANSIINALTMQADGKMLIGGSFSTVGGVTHKYLARLKSDGSVDHAFNSGVGPDSSVQGIALQNDGKILISGYFNNVNGTARAYLARLNADGSLDTSFALPSSSIFLIYRMAAQYDGKILIVGKFSAIGGVSRNGIARLNANGSLDTSFNPGSGLSFANGYDLAIQPDGKIVVAGFFQSVNGVKRGNIARLNADGSLDTAFATGSGASGWIESIKLQPDGRMVIAGPWSSYNGTARAGVARLLSDGSLDPSFDPGLGVQNGWSYAVTVQPDGKVVLGGWFTQVSEAPRLRIVRLNADGSLDGSFQPGLGASSDVQAIALEPDGKCVVAGYFTTVNGVAAPYVARILNDSGSAAPEAPASLTVSTLSSAQLSLAWTNVAWESNYLIEQSPDGINNWTQIAATGLDVTNFTLGGLAPKTTGFFRVRASSTNGGSAPSPVASGVTYGAYQQWKLDNHLPPDAPDSGDADGDGLSNIMEYVFGSDPGSSNSRHAPAAAMNGSTLQMHYTKARADVDYLVESSTDLLHWTAADVDQGGPGTDIWASTPMNSGAKFLRIRLNVP